MSLFTELQRFGVFQSSSGERESVDDCVLVSGQEVWDALGQDHAWPWWAKQMEATRDLPLRPIFEREFIEWDMGPMRFGLICTWEEKFFPEWGPHVWCRVIDSKTKADGINFLLLPFDKPPYVSIFTFVDDSVDRKSLARAIKSQSDDKSAPVRNRLHLIDAQTYTDISPTQAEWADWLWSLGITPVACLMLKLPHVKNIYLEEDPVRKGKKQRRLRPDQRVRWHRLRILQGQTRRRRSLHGESQGLTASHLCRGHNKTFSADAPLFGKYVGTYWVPAHRRGNAKIGVVEKDYSVGVNE